MIQEDQISNVGSDQIEKQIRLAGSISHPLFPKIIDIDVNGNIMFTYQEYRGEEFLDNYLLEHKLKEGEILSWMNMVIDAIEYLYAKNLAFRDFARGSMTVLRDGRIGMFRLQNLYYGVIRLQPENRQFYFEREIQELGVLLYQLCTGEIPVLPFRIIAEDRYSGRFMDKANLVIQKCSREDNKMLYGSFSEMKHDLERRHIDLADLGFLNSRRKRLQEYESVKKKYRDNLARGKVIVPLKENLEKRFGFAETVTLADDSLTRFPKIRLMVCSTCQVLEFHREKIVIGRSSECDMILDQPSVSRVHVQIKKESEDEYLLRDMNAVNGTYIKKNGTVRRLANNEEVCIRKGDIIITGMVDLQVL